MFSYMAMGMAEWVTHDQDHSGNTGLSIDEVTHETAIMNPPRIGRCVHPITLMSNGKTCHCTGQPTALTLNQQARASVVVSTCGSENP